MKTIELTVQRVVPASRDEVFDAWLNPQIPGNPWNAAEKFQLNPTVDGLFFWHLRGTSHYGRFLELDRPHRLRHTWVSPSTQGLESVVTLTFETSGPGTLLTLVHSDLPDTEEARGHERGWTYFLDIFREQFGQGSRAEYRWEAAHSSEKA